MSVAPTCCDERAAATFSGISQARGRTVGRSALFPSENQPGLRLPFGRIPRVRIREMSKSPAERRHSPRASQVQAQVECKSPAAQVRDLSLSGVYLLLPDPPPSGEELALRLSLRSGENIDARGVVRRLELGRGAAVEFTSLSPAARDLLAQFLSLQFSEKK
jgi:PilZ domain